MAISIYFRNKLSLSKKNEEQIVSNAFEVGKNSESSNHSRVVQSRETRAGIVPYRIPIPARQRDKF
jgi:hypothetical protein